ncbi:hypothetical protein [Spirosoma sp. KNUC1025]|uniref:hypothetical protein n=1 Tax=Spirosoma sp. KNUC1025 TaxID=2894082 RepID=UPI0038659E5D|nr:hypothetical protein LN737_14970 [Spirosoma sp. KNUC1025]
MIEKKQLQIYYGIIATTFFVLLYFSVTLQARGDEGGGYLDAFFQAYSIWPALDLSPAWSISSFYLWVIASAQAILANLGLLGQFLLPSGRIIALLCWLVLAIIHVRNGRHKALAILFNPYVLIYASRAHPLLPGILLFYLFWILTIRGKKIGLLFLLFAVNFQVFTGGAIGLFAPTFPLVKKDVIRVIIFGVVAICGVLITWLTWGDVPAKIYKPLFLSTYTRKW